jgi:hypothetical protein
MMRHIVFGMPDGTIALVNPSAEAIAARPAGVSEEDWLAAIAANAVENHPPLKTAIRLADAETSKLLPHPKFRDCLRYSSGKASISASVVRAQLLAELRAKRNELLAASDSDQARLADVGNAQQKAALKAYRQQLRDLPAAAQSDLDRIADVDQLAAWQPAIPDKPA